MNTWQCLTGVSVCKYLSILHLDVCITVHCDNVYEYAYVYVCICIVRQCMFLQICVCMHMCCMSLHVTACHCKYVYVSICIVCHCQCMSQQICGCMHMYCMSLSVHVIANMCMYAYVLYVIVSPCHCKYVYEHVLLSNTHMYVQVFCMWMCVATMCRRMRICMYAYTSHGSACS